MDFPELGPPGQKPIVNSIFDFSDQALAGLRLYLEQNPPAIPITSILGAYNALPVTGETLRPTGRSTRANRVQDGNQDGPSERTRIAFTTEVRCWAPCLHVLANSLLVWRRGDLRGEPADNHRGHHRQTFDTFGSSR
jgi:hypothetical protein